MSLDQKRARAFGGLYLITYVTSIVGLRLYQPVLDDPEGYIAGAGHDNRIFLGALLELLLIIANIRTGRSNSGRVGSSAGERANPRLPDVPLGPRAAADGVARARRRAADHRLRDAVMFGVDHPSGTLQGLATIPEFLWELSLGVYCTLKGFRPSSPILRPDARAAAIPAVAPG